MTTIVRSHSHSRRKPAKPQAYIETHRRLKEEVEAMKRGELAPVSIKPWAIVRAWNSLAEICRGGIAR